MLTDLIGLALLLALAAFIGLGITRAIRDWRAPVPAAGNGARSRGERFLRRAGTAAMVAVAIVVLGAQWWLARRGDDPFAGDRPPTVEEAREQLPALRAAVAESPGDAEGQYRLGTALAALGRHGEALGPFERAIAGAPDKARFRNAYAWSLLRLGRFEEAVPPLERAVALDDRYHTALLNLGYALASLDRQEEAARILERALAVQPMDAATRGVYARVLVARGRFPEAVSHAEAAAAGQPENPFHPATLARALIGMGRYAEAEQAFRRVEALAPDHFERNAEDRALRDEARRATGESGSI